MNNPSKDSRTTKFRFQSRFVEFACSVALGLAFSLLLRSKETPPLEPAQASLPAQRHTDQLVVRDAKHASKGVELRETDFTECKALIKANPLAAREILALLDGGVPRDRLSSELQQIALEAYRRVAPNEAQKLKIERFESPLVRANYYAMTHDAEGCLASFEGLAGNLTEMRGQFSASLIAGLLSLDQTKRRELAKKYPAGAADLEALAFCLGERSETNSTRVNEIAIELSPLIPERLLQVAMKQAELGNTNFIHSVGNTQLFQGQDLAWRYWSAPLSDANCPLPNELWGKLSKQFLRRTGIDEGRASVSAWVDGLSSEKQEIGRGIMNELAKEGVFDE